MENSCRHCCYLINLLKNIFIKLYVTLDNIGPGSVGTRGQSSISPYSWLTLKTLNGLHVTILGPYIWYKVVGMTALPVIFFRH